MAALAPSAAHAQLTTTTTSTGPSVEQGDQTAPERYLNYGQPDQQDLGTQTRPNGLNPTGINYSDCVSNMTLGFPVILNGFGVNENTDGMQIWASIQGTCTTDSDRGVGIAPVCWLVNSGLPLGGVPENTSTTYYIRVQDIVGPQQAPPDPPVLVTEGVSACNNQPSYAAETITLWFVPLSGEATYDTSATALQWPLTTDLVGPPAPTGLTVGAGETLLVANWTANIDSDTLGYDIFIDPAPGSLAASAASTQVICPGSSDSGAAGANAADDSTDGGDAGDAAASSASSSATSNAADAACYTINVAQGATSIGSCSSPVLGSDLVNDGGVLTEEELADGAVVFEDAGTDETADGSVITGVGGIATIPCQYAYDLNGACSSGSPVYTALGTTLTGESNTTKNIEGLIDGVTYAVTVTAVDNSGNPGPPAPQSPTTCNYPAPVNDFFSLYRDAGGLAGGGFCDVRGGTKLEASSGSPIGASIALGAAGIAVLAAGRRRRRRQ